LEAKFTNHHKRNVGSSWRIDETYIRVKGKWCYLYRAVDKSGATIDFLLTEKRDKIAAKRFFVRLLVLIANLNKSPLIKVAPIMPAEIN